MAKANSRAKPNITITICRGGTPRQYVNRNKMKGAIEEDEDAPPPSKKSLAWLLDSGDKMREIFSRECTLTDKRKEKIKNADKNTSKKSKGRVSGRSSFICRKNKASIELFNDILKSELMINDADCAPSPKKKKKSSHMYPPINSSQYESPVSTEITNGISSPESLDSNSNRIKSTKTKPANPPNKPKERKPKKVKTKANKEGNSKAKKVTVSEELNQKYRYLFECDYCQKTFSTKTSLRRHIYIHLGIKPYSCDFCQKRFSQLTNLKGHAERKHLDYIPHSYTCNLCHKPFLLKESLALHIQSHLKTKNALKCSICKMKFSDQIFLTKHEKHHHQDKKRASGRYKCSICNMRYDSRSQLSLHVKKHLNIKDYVCQYCGKEFLRPNSVRRHIEICHGGFRIQCPICLKHLKGHLTEHLRTHDNKRPHKCPECGQGFTQATQLTVHLRSHTGARPYPCRICDRPFTHSNALMLHIRRHTGEKPFTCAMCPNSFSQLPHMKAHMKKIHGKEAPYKCQKCNEFFKLKALLEEHVRSCTTFDEKMQASLDDVPVVESPMSLSRMRFLLALLLTMIATKEKLKYLGAYYYIH